MKSRRKLWLPFVVVVVMGMLPLGVALYEVVRTDAKVFVVSDYGVKPNGENASVGMAEMMKKVRKVSKRRPIVIRFEEGRYDFWSKGAECGEFYVSNHDHVDSLHVGIWLRDLKNVTVEGNGAVMMMHGELIPIAMQRVENCVVKGVSVDYAHPHIVQVEVKENRGKEGIVFELAPFYNYKVEEGRLMVYDEDVVRTPYTGIAFEKETKHLLYNVADLDCNLTGVKTTNKSRVLYGPNWVDGRLVEGTIVALRTYERPTPGIFMERNKNVELRRVTVGHADGMGLLAQYCENVLLDSFNVCLIDKQRYFTTQADATHFSGCKGKITSRNGLYEGMMDDAINVHGTYLNVESVVDSNTITARFMHDQSFGFEWCDEGDEVQMVDRETMVACGKNVIKGMEWLDRYTVRLTLEKSVELDGNRSCGVENLTWNPEVEFAKNVVRNNRARGALFSTLKRVVVEENEFDHVSGTAVLLCGDCNGWYESSACEDVVIRNNVMRNVLTSRYQFCEAAISICPVIKEMKEGEYFHKNVVIEGNRFETFDMPIVYALSVDGLEVKNNVVETTTDYAPLQKEKQRVQLRQVNNAVVEGNVADGNPW